jgi:hypothetical protein
MLVVKCSHESCVKVVTNPNPFYSHTQQMRGTIIWEIFYRLDCFPNKTFREIEQFQLAVARE